MWSDLLGGLMPLSLRRLQAEVDERLAKIPNRLNEYGYDPYGFSPAYMSRGVAPAALIYRHWFRCETFGIDQLPPGRVLLIANHAGQLPIDALMLTLALLLEAEPPRVARSMGE